MNKNLPLATALFMTICHNVIACDPQENDRPQNIHSGKVTKIVNVESSILNKYLPKNINSVTLQGFKENAQDAIKIGERDYVFIGGTQVSSGVAKPLASAKDVLPSSTYTVLTLDEAIVNLSHKCMLLTYKFDSMLYKNLSYTFTVQTSLDKNEVAEEVQFSILLNRFIPTRAHRDAFSALKTQDQDCEIEDKSYYFVSAKAIYSDHEEIIKSAQDVLPADLPLNKVVRADHKLIDVRPDFQHQAVLLTYEYDPSRYYTLSNIRNGAQSFAFTVATLLDEETNYLFQIRYLSMLSQDLTAQSISMNQRDLISNEFLSTFLTKVQKNISEGKVAIAKKWTTLIDIKDSISELEEMLEGESSPVNLIIQNKISDEVYERCKKNTQFDVSTESIDKFIPGFSLASAE